MERPYSPTASDQENYEVNEDGGATDTVHYHYPEEPPKDVGPTTDYELVVVNIPTAEENVVQPANLQSASHYS